MKKYYEVALQQQVKHDNCDDDYETMEFVDAENYRDAVRTAKKYSLLIGQEKIGNKTFAESDNLNSGLANVSLVCYAMNDTSTYDQIFHEYYKDGRKSGDRYYWNV